MKWRVRVRRLAWIAAGAIVLIWIAVRPGAAGPRPAAPSIMDVAPPPGSPDALIELRGEVVDADGTPVPAALVTLVDPGGRSDVLGPGRPTEFRDRETIADDAGRFRFGGLRPGPRMLVARAGTRAPAWTEPFALERSGERRLTLPAPVSIAGLTRPEARLWVECRIPGLPIAGHEPFARAAVADEAGNVRIDGLPPDVSFSVRVEASGYRNRIFGPYALAPGRHFLRFDLDTGWTLKGSVRDGAGRPVEGARVTFDDARTLTDAEGGFTLAGLEERTTTLVVSRDGFVQTAVPSVRPGSVEVLLPRAAELTGRVEDGRARYVCYSLGAARYRRGIRPGEEFRLPSIPPGPLQLDIEDAEGRLLSTVQVDAPEGGLIDLAAR